MAEAMKPTQAGDATAPLPLLSAADLAPHFPQLDILECLGRGGMGVVYKARQKTLNRLVALKLLAPERADDPSFASRFAREAQALAALNHPHIVGVHDFGQAGGFFYLMMEYVDGVNLRQLLQARKLTPEEALRIVPPICDALQCAHNRGIVHRDIKPENLLIDKSGNVKIADFGIAKMVGAAPSASEDESQASSAATTPDGTMTVGTPDYAAPEQHAGSATTDHRADIYSLGVVFYEMLTGERPGKQLIPPSKRVLVDVRIDGIVLRALEKTPELRFQTADEFRTQVQTVSQGLASDASPHSSPRVLRVSAGMLTTPDRIASASGQFWHFSRSRGHLVLDDRQITFTQYGHATVIPLASIQDLSLGWYPRVMNPAGIKLISVSYVEGGSVKQVLLMPQEGFFGLPSQFNQNTVDWWSDARRAVERITGKQPQQTPAENLGIPSSASWVLIAMLAPAILGLLFFAEFSRRAGAPGTFLESLFRPAMLFPLTLGAGFLLVMLLGNRGRRGQPLSPDVSASTSSSATTIVTPHANTVSAEASRGSSASPLAGAAAFFAAFSGILGIWAWLSEGESAALNSSILATALLGIFLAMPVAQRPFGKAALVVGSINTALWIFFATVRVPAPPATATVDTSPPVVVVAATHQPSAVKQAELNLAQQEFSQKDAAYKAGIIDTTEYDAAKAKVDLLAAELTGDPVTVAEVTLTAAQRRLERLERLYKDGRITAFERTKAQGEVAIAGATLLEAKRKGAGTKDGPAPQGQPSKQVLEVVLQAAEAEAALLKPMYEMGQVDALEYQAAQLKVEVLKAELAGDPVQVAETHLRAAREHLRMISQLVADGRRDPLEQIRAQGEVSITEARLKEAMAKLKEATTKASGNP
jgi:tRNA A-37 threonylcarbamoyl transferase component Bud32